MKNIIINLHGPICSGKTTVSKLIHERIPRSFLISGDRIKWLISDYSANQDRDTVSLMVYDLVKRALEANFVVIKDSNYMLWIESDLPQKYLDMFKEHNSTVYQFNLEAPLDVLLERLHSRVERSEKENKKVSVKSDDTFMKYYEMYTKMKNSELKTFDTSKQAPEEIANEILSFIETTEKNKNA
jgi:thymidylate kinase